MSSNFDEKLQDAQKQILAFLNAKSDNRASSKELVDNIEVPPEVLCQSLALLNEKEFVKGPSFTKQMIEDGGNSSFRDSTKLTASGQQHYIEIIKENK